MSLYAREAIGEDTFKTMGDTTTFDEEFIDEIIRKMTKDNRGLSNLLDRAGNNAMLYSGFEAKMATIRGGAIIYYALDAIQEVEALNHLLATSSAPSYIQPSLF